mmetsp:Transcript_29259/g.63630  ORF Transcript_29259/g.63630 Transcript_29259/m.63630 type:complete len:749 (+) Transcript_29259:73-2319(+)
MAKVAPAPQAKAASSGNEAKSSNGYAAAVLEPPLRYARYVKDSAQWYQENADAAKREVLSGITISILKVPESVAFAYLAGVHPLQGLYGSFFMSLVTALIGGRPGMISGCAGALAVVLKVVMEDSGPFGHKCLEDRREYVFFTMALTGVLQQLCGALQCAKLVKLIPKTAFLGFFNGLAIVIFLSQLDTFRKTGARASSTVANCPEVDYGFLANKEWWGLDEGTTWLMLLHVAIVMTIMEGMPRLPTLRLGVWFGDVRPEGIMPPSLVGLIMVMLLEWCLIRPVGGGTPIVKDMSRLDGGFPSWHIPDVPWDEWYTWWECFKVAAALCAIGLVESVLTLQAVDQILDEYTPVYRQNQECFAQGVANLLSGFFMAIGGDAMIGQSTINVLNGAKGRLSAITDAIFLMFYICFFGPLIELVPTAGLAGVLFIVVIHTWSWPSVAIIARRALPLYMCATIVIVTVLAVVTNLAIGIGVGILWECVWFVWREGTELDVTPVELSKTKKTYRVAGNLFFVNADDFGRNFTPAQDPQEVVVDLANSRLLDFSAIFSLNAVGRRYELVDKKLSVWMTAEDHARYLSLCDEALRKADPAVKSNLKDRGLELLRKLPTGTTRSIEGKVTSHDLFERRFQNFDLKFAKSSKDEKRITEETSMTRRPSQTILHAFEKLTEPSKPWQPHKAPHEHFFEDAPPHGQTQDMAPRPPTLREGANVQAPDCMDAPHMPLEPATLTVLGQNAGSEVPMQVEEEWV